MLAALTGAYFLWMQISQTQVALLDKRQRELDKTRILAQFQLSTLISHVDLMAKDIKTILDTNGKETSRHFDAWPTPALEALANMQLHLEDKDRVQIGQLFMDMQVLQSRVVGVAFSGYNSYIYWRGDWILNGCLLAKVKSGINSLFGYCRLETNTFPSIICLVDRTHNTFSFWDIDLKKDDDPGVDDKKIISRWIDRHAKLPVAWYEKSAK